MHMMDCVFVFPQIHVESLTPQCSEAFILVKVT